VKTTEIKIGGFGGQGVIMMGYIIGKAASIYAGGHATMTQAFGPEARGSACSSQVIISPDPVLYPYVTLPEIMILMSQEAYSKFSPEIAKNGIMLVEKDLVKPEKVKEGVKVYAIPATRFAEELGLKIVLNIVMLGFFTGVTKLIDAEAMRKAVETSVPEGTQKKNLEAFDKGYNYGLELVGSTKEKEAGGKKKKTAAVAK
jgi:2-oxoglutarate ferredoxin oxidoreductase subunit gamma